MLALGRRKRTRGSSTTSVASRRRSQGEGRSGRIHSPSSRGGARMSASVRASIARMSTNIVSGRANVSRHDSLSVDSGRLQCIRQGGSQKVGTTRRGAGTTARVGFREQRGRGNGEVIVDSGLFARDRQDTKHGWSDGLSYSSVSNLFINSFNVFGRCT